MEKVAKLRGILSMISDAVCPTTLRNCTELVTLRRQLLRLIFLPSNSLPVNSVPQTETVSR